MSVVVFFSGWLTGELPYHHLAWQGVATASFILAGALRQWPGWLGLAITLVSWTGLVSLARRARSTAEVAEAALSNALGPDYRDAICAERVRAWPPAVAWRQIVLPLPIRRVGVTRTKDIVFSEPDGRPLKLDVFRPADGRTGCPVVLFIHGSAWITGDKREQGLPMMVRMAAHGWVCVTANHRLSPRATFPDHLIDVKQALRWVREHAADYGGDPGFVIMSGASAGAHLATLTALTPNDPRYQPGFEDLDTRVQGAVLFYGVYDLTNRIGARGRGFGWFVERIVMKKRMADDPAAFADASPMDQVRADAPPTMILHGTNDSLVPIAEARHFAELLSVHSESPVVFVELAGAQHAFEVFPSVRALQAVAAVERFCDWVWCEELRRRGTCAHPTRLQADPPASLA